VQKQTTRAWIRSQRQDVDKPSFRLVVSHLEKQTGMSPGKCCTSGCLCCRELIKIAIRRYLSPYSSYILAAVQVIRINIAPHFATHLSYAAVQTYHADVSQRIYHIRSCTCDNKSYSAGHCTSVVHTSGAVVYTITVPPGFLPFPSSSSFCGRAAYRLDDEISPPKANRASTVSGMQRE